MSDINEKLAAKIVKGIWEDISDRSGIQDAFECCDTLTQIEIKKSWKQLILNNLEAYQRHAKGN
jgi:hypothetical protein